MAKILNIIGCLLLLHAAYSYKHYKSLIVSMNLTISDSPPIDVIIELVVAFVLIVLGQLSKLALKPIKVSAEIKGKSYEEVMGRTDFMVFNHRGRSLASRLQKSDK